MVRHVASPEGEKRFGLPLHAPILPKPPTARVSQFFTAQTDSLNFYQAIAALNSPQHRSFATASLSINDKYGAKTVSTRDMVGDTAQYGTEDSVMQNLRIDAETSRYIAAEKGLAGNQLSVLNFVHSKSGPDAMVTVAMPESMSLKDLRAILDERGLEFRSIDPKTNELVFFSGGGDKLAEIGQLAKDYANGKIRISRGAGEFVGSDESREDAANVYRSILARPRFGSSGRDGRRFGDPNHGISETSIDKLIAASSSSSREGRTMGSLENLIVALSGQKHVRTPEGAQKYGQPIGSLIQLHLEAISHANSLHDASGVNTHTPHAGMPSEFGPAHAAASTMHPPAPTSPHQAPSKPGVSKPLAKGAPASPEFGPAQTKATLGAPKPSSAHQAPSGSSEFGPAHAKATMHAPASVNAHQAPSKPSGSKPLASGAASPEFGAAQTKATLGAPKPSSAHQAPSATPKVDKLASKVGKAAPGAPKAGATKGTGSKADPIVTSDVVEAAKALGEGKFVTLNSRHEVSTLIDKLAEIVDDAKKKGENAPTYDLCKVSVPGTNLFCVDEFTEIMTADGWRRYDQIDTGTVALTLNHKTGLSEWEPLLAVNVFPAGPRIVRSIEARGHSSLTTLDHKWPVLRGSHRPWTTTAKMQYDDRIVTAAPCVNVPVETKYEDALVEIVAWTWTEGTRTDNSVRIYQSETKHPEYCASIRAALTRLYGEATVNSKPGVYYDRAVWRETLNNETGMVSFHLNKMASEPVLAHMDYDKVVSPRFICELTTSQLRLFLEKSIDADGWRSPTPQLSQRSELRVRSFEMVCAILGIQTSTVAAPETRVGRDPGLVQFTASLYATTYACPQRKPGNAIIENVSVHEGIVWCPTTSNGTWLARRNGTVFYTGNCAESKGIPRTMMPQLKGIPLPGTPADKMQKNDKGEVDLGPEFVKWLKENKGIDVVDANIDASHLKASQNQLNGAKVAGMSQAMLAGKVPESPIFVTQDDYIVDGHHRWAANVANEIKTNKAITMPTYQIKSDIIHVLAYANHFTKHNGIPQAGVGAPAPTGAGPKTDLQAKKAGMAGTATEQLAAKAGKKK